MSIGHHSQPPGHGVENSAGAFATGLLTELNGNIGGLQPKPITSPVDITGDGDAPGMRVAAQSLGQAPTEFTTVLCTDEHELQVLTLGEGAFEERLERDITEFLGVDAAKAGNHPGALVDTQLGSGGCPLRVGRFRGQFAQVMNQ